MKTSNLISKSAFLAGRQCGKLLWTRFNARDEIPPRDPSLQAIFEQGHRMEDLARSLFPDGIEIAAGVTDPDEVFRASLKAVAFRLPLFEAGFEYKGASARADILLPVEKDGWDILEVKSVTEVKDVHLWDLALQSFVYAGAGLNVRRCVIVHLNRDYVRCGELQPERLFARTDCTKAVAAICKGMEKELDNMRRLIVMRTRPDVPIGPWCTTPYICPVRDRCWNFLPKHSVMDLYRGKAKGFDLLKRGIAKIANIPDNCSLTDNQKIQLEAVRTGNPRISKFAIGQFLSSLEYPVHFLDFETVSTPIPLFDGLKPYQRLPFQFSLHIQRSPGSKLEHHAFLANGDSDPRPDFMARLRTVVGDHGSIVAFNATFEKGVLKECATAFTEHKTWVQSLEPRFADLLQPFRSFRYYHPEQCGSASMKSVLPALTNSGYEHLAIRDGDTASREFLRVTFENVSAEERQRIRSQLEAYCGVDTHGMYQIVQALNDLG